MIKKLTLAVCLLVATGSLTAQNLGVYVGGVYGSGAMSEDAEGMEYTSSLALPLAGVTYTMQAGPVPLMLGGGLGQRVMGISMDFLGVEMGSISTFTTIDMFAVVPYPVMEMGNGHVMAMGGLMLGHFLSGKTALTLDGAESESVDIEDEAMPSGMDMSLLLGVNVPVMDKVSVSLGYALGLAENKADGSEEGVKFSGLFFNAGYSF